MKLTRRQLLQAGGSGLGLGLLAGQSFTLNAATAANQRVYPIDKLIHGVCYYPELWPVSNIDADIEEMLTLGINMVRMGEFTWALTEPEPGEYDFSLLKLTMDKMHQAGISVVLCTPTATPPVWLTHDHPERLHKNDKGEIMSHGARQHASYAHPAVRNACYNIVEKMAAALGRHPSVIAWQIDNEMKAHVANDFSDAAVANWHQWLKKRFTTIENLNEAWGTHVWSMHYQSFEQVPAPVVTPFLHNASLSTAYTEFNREDISDFMLGQRERIRMHSSAPVTHNDNPAFNINHETSMDAQDFPSFDAYPSYQQWSALVFRSDLYRAAIPGKPFWLMETSVSHNGWLGNHQEAHPTGYLAAEAALIYALGGKGFSYWLWRQQRTGAELPHSAIKSTWNAPSVGYEEVRKVGALRNKLDPVLAGAEFQVPEVAVTYSDLARAMFETEGMDKREGFPSRYRDVIAKWHHYFIELGIARDVRFEHATLDGLKLLVTPAMPVVTEAFLARILPFVQAGGIWIAGPLTGYRDKNHTNHTTAGLGLLDKFAGVHTEFVVPLTGMNATGSAMDMTVPLSGWTAAMQPLPGTRSLGTMTSGIVEGRSFLTERTVGKGKVVVLGGQPHGEEGDKLVSAILSHYAREAGVTPAPKADPGIVSGMHRLQDGRLITMTVNMTDSAGTISFPHPVSDHATSEKLSDDSQTVAPYQYRLFVHR